MSCCSATPYKCFSQLCSDPTCMMANPLLPYSLVAMVKRRIPKFNVEGTQYTLSIPAIQQNDLPFNIVNAMVHDVFARKYVLLLLLFFLVFFFSYKFFKYVFSPPLKVSWENCCTRMMHPDILIITESDWASWVLDFTTRYGYLLFRRMIWLWRGSWLALNVCCRVIRNISSLEQWE